MASVPRAVGMIVVCIEATVLIMTTRISAGPPHDPSSGTPTVANTSSMFSSLPSPASPTPAYACSATVTSR